MGPTPLLGWDPQAVGPAGLGSPRMGLGPFWAGEALPLTLGWDGTPCHGWSRTPCHWDGAPRLGEEYPKAVLEGGAMLQDTPGDCAGPPRALGPHRLGQGTLFPKIGLMRGLGPCWFGWAVGWHLAAPQTQVVASMGAGRGRGPCSEHPIPQVIPGHGEGGGLPLPLLVRPGGGLHHRSHPHQPIRPRLPAGLLLPPPLRHCHAAQAGPGSPCALGLPHPLQHHRHHLQKHAVGEGCQSPAMQQPLGCSSGPPTPWTSPGEGTGGDAVPGQTPRSALSPRSSSPASSCSRCRATSAG